MTTLSLREAAEATGVSKSTIFRAIKSGKMSAPRTEDGGFLIDPAELFRVYPPKEQKDAQRDAERSGGQSATSRNDSETIELKAKMAAMEAELRSVQRLLDEVQHSRDDWREQATRLTALLPKPEDKPAEAPKSRSWFGWRRAS